MKEAKVQITVEVGIDSVWNAFAKDHSSTLMKIIPNIAKNCQIVEGNGGLGTIFLVEFGSEKASLGYQKKKVSAYDESSHEFGLEVIEGGYLNHGFSSYNTLFRFTAAEKSNTIVDIKVMCEIEEDNNHTTPEETINNSVSFIKSLEKYLLKQEQQVT